MRLSGSMRLLLDGCNTPVFRREESDAIVGDTRCYLFFFFSSRRRHTRLQGDWSSDVCSSDLNEAADSQVEYGTTTVYGSSTTLNTFLVTSHSINVAGLLPSTTYHYRVKSHDEIGRASCRGRV